jgi:hypothetical protein
MRKLITTSVLAFVAFAVLANGAEAAGRRRCSPTYAVVAAPVAAAPTTAQAGASGQGYRTFSYQPAAPVYRSYSAPKMQSWDYPKTDARRYSNVR